jgi:hypothetical protein
MDMRTKGLTEANHFQIMLVVNVTRPIKYKIFVRNATLKMETFASKCLKFLPEYRRRIPEGGNL